MIIWISGAYGVGKSTLAETLAGKMENAMIFDAEEVGNAVRDNYPDMPYGAVYEDYPLWCEFNYLLLKDIHTSFRRNILVPMTLLRQSSYDSIIARLQRDGIDTRLIILEATRQCIHDRILARGEDEDCWCMQHIDMSSRAASAITNGWHLSADRLCPDELADAVLSRLHTNE